MTILIAILAAAIIIVIFLIEGLGVGLSTIEREERSMQPREKGGSDE